MTADTQREAINLAQFYFRRIAEAAGWQWDDDNDTEVEMMVSFIIDAAAAGLRGQLAEALEHIDMLDRLRPTCVICTDATADRQTSIGPACTDCVGDPPDDPATWVSAEDWADGPDEAGPVAAWCPGCVGRGTGTTCCMCGAPVPEALRRRPGDPPELQAGCAGCAAGIVHVHGDPGRPETWASGEAPVVARPDHEELS